MLKPNKNGVYLGGDPEIIEVHLRGVWVKIRILEIGAGRFVTGFSANGSDWGCASPATDKDTHASRSAAIDYVAESLADMHSVTPALVSLISAQKIEQLKLF